jgi:SAM-dependent methyltransferase
MKYPVLNPPRILIRSPLFGAIAAQLLGTVLAIMLFYFIMPEVLRTPLLAALVQGACAAIASHQLKAPKWWQAIHLAFVPLLVLGLGLALPPWVWLGGFGLLLLIFWRTDKSRVPLYLTNSTTAAALVPLLPSSPSYVLDAGCGDGGLLRHLARARPDCEFVGIEHAPLTWLWARLLSSNLPNLHIRLGNFWQQPLAPFDLVYTFLSPTPMPALWQKAVDEMRPGCVLVSNSFAVPDITPESVLEVPDRRQTRLYCYRPANESPAMAGGG